MNTIAAGSLIRTRGGAVVHRAGCVSVLKGLPRSKPVPWAWADGRKYDEVLMTIQTFGYQICRDCQPFVIQEET